MPNVWQEPSPSDWDRWEARLIAGEEPSSAAKADGFTASAFKRSDKIRHAEMLELSREARGWYVDEHVETWALDPEASDTMRIHWSKRHNNAYRDRSLQGVTGDGRKVEVVLAFLETPDE